MEVQEAKPPGGSGAAPRLLYRLVFPAGSFALLTAASQAAPPLDSIDFHSLAKAGSVGVKSASVTPAKTRLRSWFSLLAPVAIRIGEQAVLIRVSGVT